MTCPAQFKCVSLLVALLAVLCACQPTPVIAPFSLQIVVHTDASAPVPAATILLDGVAAGMTDATGELHLTSSAPEGRILMASVKCPGGYESGSQPIAMALRHLATLDGTHTPPALRQRFVCNASEQTSVVVVSVGAANLPVRVSDTVQAITNPSGVAHVALRGKPGTSFTMTLDTTAHPELQPQNPTRTFTLGKTPELFAFQQQVNAEQSTGRRVRRGSEKVATIPYRVQ